MKKHSSGSGVGFGRRSLRVEQLEGRSMLAGNVFVGVDAAGDLLVTGDNHDNLVLIQQVDVGEYSVTGADFNDVTIDGTHQGGPTSINGDANGTVTVSGVTGNIIVNLKNGNDALGIGNSIDDLASLAEDCGFGFGFNSQSATPELAVPGDKFFAPANLIVNLGTGSNDVAVVADVALSLTITQSAAAKGSDNIAVGGSASNESDAIIGSQLIPGSVVISTGKGNDNICVDHATIYGSLAINAGAGNNEVSATNFDALSASVVAGKGNTDDIRLNSFNVDTVVAVTSLANSNNVTVSQFDSGEGDGPNGLPLGTGGVSIVTGSAVGHTDNVSVVNFGLRGNLAIVTGRGNDNVFVSNEVDNEVDGPDDDDILGNVVINTGVGNDEVDLGCGRGAPAGASAPNGCPNLDIVGNLVVSLGAGSDFLSADDVFVFQDANGANGNATIDAGSGNDDVEISDSTIDTIFTIAMGAGNDFLSIFGSGGGTPIAMLIADGGPGRDEFDNDLGITHNGVQDVDPLGVPHEIIKNFEIFNADMIPVATAKIKKGW